MEFHRSTSASRQSRLSSHLNATDVSRGAITSDGRLLTRTGLYRAAHRQHRQPPPQSHNPANPTSTPRSPSPLSLSLSLSSSQPLAPFLRKLSTIHRFVSFVSVGTTQRLCVYIYSASPFSLCIYSRTYERGCGCERDETTKST